MKFSQQPLQTFRLRNFKAVRDSRSVKFTPLTVFIGNNGSGKSSLIEGLETYQIIVTQGLDEAMNRWRGFENIRNKAVLHLPRYPEGQRPCASNSIQWEIRGGYLRYGEDDDFARDAFFRFEMEVNASPTLDEVFIQREMIRNHIQDDRVERRDSYGRTEVDWLDGNTHTLEDSNAGESIIKVLDQKDVFAWQFLNLHPETMGQPAPQKRTGRTVQMDKDGANIGDYLLGLMRQPDGIETLNGIIEALRYVLPYAVDVQPAITSELQRTVYLQLSEGHFKIPGWLLSTGTLRVLALLSVLRHPNPPPLLFIEEIENGLDPRTINLLVEEIQRVTESGRTQVVCTTHSPYFLDLVPLSSVVVVERDQSGQPTFTRPDEAALGEWAKKFAPGQLYTMSQLTRRTNES